MAKSLPIPNDTGGSTSSEALALSSIQWIMARFQVRLKCCVGNYNYPIGRRLEKREETSF